MKLVLFSLLLTAGCATSPNLWSPGTHKEMLMECRATCGEGKFLSYDSMSGNCKCYPALDKDPTELLLKYKYGK